MLLAEEDEERTEALFCLYMEFCLASLAGRNFISAKHAKVLTRCASIVVIKRAESHVEQGSSPPICIFWGEGQ